MWVDPGEVEISYVNNPRQSQVIYQAGSLHSTSPPPRSPSPVYYPSSDISYYDSLSYTEPNLMYYPSEPYVFYSDSDPYDSQVNGLTTYPLPVQHELAMRM